MGPIRTLLHKVIAPFGGQLIPGGTHPVVVVRATGQKVKEAGTVLLDDMQEDLGKMSAREFHNRYIDL